MSSVQAGARAAIQTDRSWSQATVRLRSHAALPIVETELAGGARPFGPLEMSGSLSWSDWRKGGGALRTAHARAWPFLGCEPRRVLRWQRRAVPARRDGLPVLTEQNTVRGGEFQRAGRAARSSVRPRTRSRVRAPRPWFAFPSGEVSGGMGRGPLLGASPSRAGTPAGRTPEWIYQPSGLALASCIRTAHSSGNLDILARIEGRHRARWPCRPASHRRRSSGNTVFGSTSTSVSSPWRSSAGRTCS